jgi:hypothetical protein
MAIEQKRRQEDSLTPAMQITLYLELARQMDPPQAAGAATQTRKRGPRVYAELRKFGVAPSVAKRVAANTRRWWRNSAMLVQLSPDARYYDRMGVPRLAR